MGFSGAGPFDSFALSPSTPLVLSLSKHERRSGQACRSTSVAQDRPVEGYILSLSKGTS